jgi:glycosyltransferase involved in cell wall biosynthesis
MVKKKKILFHSDFALSKTGFGRNTKAILSYLYKTGKYDIVCLGGGIAKNHPETERTPWKTHGSLPNSGKELAHCNSSPDIGRLYSYGAFELDNIIKLEKPDIYFGVQDFWGLDYSINKSWFNNITSVIWTTLDSLPLLNTAITEAPKIKNFWVWSDFAEKEMHRLGHKHVKTVHGAVEVSDFKILSSEQKRSLRSKNNIENETYVIGFVFRNQLRKSVPNLLQGFKILKDSNPNLKTKLLLHTNWQEGWNIQKICGESGVDIKDVLTTYVCKACRGYEVKNFSGNEVTCSSCKTENSCTTTGTTFGISEKQLNEVYNMMDVYCHPFTSGGQEIPIQEAKLTGLITLVTNYSCGEDMCQPEAHSLPLAWNEYREFGTEFIKASTSPQSIADQLKKVLAMPLEEKAKIGKLARKWTIDNFATNVICDKIEKFIESCDYGNYENTENKYIEKNPYAQIPYVEDSALWLKCLYSLILKTDVADADGGLLHWIEKLKTGTPRQSIESYFREVATKDNDKHKEFKIEELFSGSNPEDRIFVSIDSNLENIFLSTKIISSIKEKYPDKKIFVGSTESCQAVFSGNTMIESAIIKSKEFEDPEFLKNNFFESYCLDSFCINNNHSLLIK